MPEMNLWKPNQNLQKSKKFTFLTPIHIQFLSYQCCKTTFIDHHSLIDAITNKTRNDTHAWSMPEMNLWKPNQNLQKSKKIHNSNTNSHAVPVLSMHGFLLLIVKMNAL